MKDLAGLPPFRPPLSGFGGLGVTFVEIGEPMTQLIGRGFCEDFPGEPCAANGIATVNNVKLGNTAPNFRLGFTNDVTYSVQLQRGARLSERRKHRQPHAVPL